MSGRGIALLRMRIPQSWDLSISSSWSSLASCLELECASTLRFSSWHRHLHMCNTICTCRCRGSFFLVNVILAIIWDTWTVIPGEPHREPNEPGKLGPAWLSLAPPGIILWEFHSSDASSHGNSATTIFDTFLARGYRWCLFVSNISMGFTWFYKVLHLGRFSWQVSHCQLR